MEKQILEILARMETKINTIETKVDAIETKVSTIEIKVNTMEQDICDLKEGQERIEKKLESNT